MPGIFTLNDPIMVRLVKNNVFQSSPPKRRALPCRENATAPAFVSLPASASARRIARGPAALSHRGVIRLLCLCCIRVAHRTLVGS
jgi:hypothetical protein